MPPAGSFLSYGFYQLKTDVLAIDIISSLLKKSRDDPYSFLSELQCGELD